MEDRGRGRRAADTVLHPTLSDAFEGLEYSVHVPAASVRRELKTVFPGTDVGQILVVPTVQQARCSLLSWGEEQAEEKDRLLERFVRWCEAVKKAVLKRETAWIDAVDPASGVALWGGAAGVYNEVDGFARTLGYDVQLVGSCPILEHPAWRFRSYPATLFCAARRNTLLHALAEVNGATS
ncbi:Methylmalonic aciduria and homocystinuria type D protein, mitochondrial [Gracilariopsis chorda]|uniref:Methylmalonic aciduria and homocystinuria type D protein, mitochondrial n=1 Tax=Gracilariopsis chorda TaxID=448386 RepID=A0A2V3IQ40_9FLOR|nr:Methylmalonic aciduria and homocystinuria type D protein, mitochondrial [Gracilariopsis chorda]|eukprot:PXF44202.1 Methylmalonic aciduria and homocystinuria type D protein, mitochondrial [Gracilariopsis chorda]